MNGDGAPYVIASWEIMSKSRETLGATELQKIFSRGLTQVNRYCMGEHYADYQRNPIDRLRILFEQLAQVGEEELVRAAINYLSEPIGCRAVAMGAPKPDKDTVEEECLDDFPELTELDRLIGRCEHPRVVQRQAEKVKQEVDETVVRYLEHWERIQKGRR
ncbi:MAG: hypothetical protein AB7E47_08620 [Desulfovibrionaceae bacterium]